MSKRAALAFGLGASLLLAAGTANAAGNCTAEIDALQQQLGMDQGANATTGPSDPGVQQPSPSASVDTGTSTPTNDQIAGTGASTTTDSNANATIGANGAGVQQPAPEANATTGTDSSTTTGTDADNGSSVATSNENTGANATVGATDPGVQQPSPEAIGSSSSTMPSGTVTETSRSGTLSVEPSARSSALASLEKAKLYAKSGEEEACMSEVNSAKQTLGVQ
jgi:hypothetical protein